MKRKLIFTLGALCVFVAGNAFDVRALDAMLAGKVYYFDAEMACHAGQHPVQVPAFGRVFECRKKPT